VIYIKNKGLYLLLILFILNVGIVNAQPLVQIEEGDNWIYEYNSVSNNKVLKSELVVCNVTNYIYYGGTNDKIRLNNLYISKIIDTFNSIDILYNKIIIKENDTNYLSFTINSLNYINDTIYKTARGNLNYLRETYFNSSIDLFNIVLNNNTYNDVTINGIFYIKEMYQDPTFIEVLSTGIVKDVTIDIAINGDFYVPYLNKTMNLYLYTVKTLRFESSNEFIYNNKNCRNLTIVPLSHEIYDINLFDDNYERLFYNNEMYKINIVNNYKENWIYSYDVGLPLYIDKIKTDVTKQLLDYNTNKQVDISPKVIMKLIDFDIQNALINGLGENETNIPNFYFWSSIFMIIVVIVTVAVTYVVTKNK